MSNLGEKCSQHTTGFRLTPQFVCIWESSESTETRRTLLLGYLASDERCTADTKLTDRKGRLLLVVHSVSGLNAPLCTHGRHQL